MTTDAQADLSRVVIDTNVFLVLLGCLRFSHAAGPERARALREIRGGDDSLPAERFDDLWHLFLGATRRIITQHVIAEVYGFKRFKDLVWHNAIALLADFDIEEVPCSVRDLQARVDYRPILLALGPTDAGLLQTAQQQKATLLTEDGTLRDWARSRAVPALSLHEIGLG